MQEIGTIFEVIAGQNIKMENQSSNTKPVYILKPADILDSGLIHIGANNHNENSRLNSQALETTYIDETICSKIKPNRFLQKNDVVLVTRGTAFRAGLIVSIETGALALVSQNLMILRPQHDNAHWLVNFFNSSWFNHHYIQVKHASKLKISTAEISRYPLNLPTDQERKAIAEDIIETQDIIQTANKLIQEALALSETKVLHIVKTNTKEPM